MYGFGSWGTFDGTASGLFLMAGPSLALAAVAAVAWVQARRNPPRGVRRPNPFADKEI